MGAVFYANKVYIYYLTFSCIKYLRNLRSNNTANSYWYFDKVNIFLEINNLIVFFFFQRIDILLIVWNSRYLLVLLEFNNYSVIEIYFLLKDRPLFSRLHKTGWAFRTPISALILSTNWGCNTQYIRPHLLNQLETELTGLHDCYCYYIQE